MAGQDSAAAAWAGLDQAWQEAFRQAWQALRAGNIGVGAVVTTAEGSMVHASRNRVADAEGPAGEVYGSSLAHAEMNVLARLPFRHPKELILTTTLQPCLQCAAAIRFGPVGLVRVAGADVLWEGSHDFTRHSGWAGRRPPVPMEGPRGDQIGAFGTLISRFGLGLVPAVEDGLRALGDGSSVDLAQQIQDSGRLDDLLARPVEEAMAELWAELSRLSRGTTGASLSGK